MLVLCGCVCVSVGENVLVFYVIVFNDERRGVYLFLLDSCVIVKISGMTIETKTAKRTRNLRK